MKPYSSQKISVSIQPNVEIRRETEMIIYTQFATVSSGNLVGQDEHESAENVVELGIKFRLFPTCFEVMDEQGCHVTQSKLDFGEIKLNSEKSLTLKIRNPSEEIPLQIEFGKMPNFAVEPTVLSFIPGEIRKLKVTCKPHQLGRITQKVQVKLRDSEKRKFCRIPG